MITILLILFYVSYVFSGYLLYNYAGQHGRCGGMNDLCDSYSNLSVTNFPLQVRLHWAIELLRGRSSL